MPAVAPTSDRGSGLISTAAGVVVFLMFLLFAVQLLFGLYATSTVTAVANDAATRAASRASPTLRAIEGEARTSLGRIGEDAHFTWAADDTNGDGRDDTVVLTITVRPPRFVPGSLGGSSPSEIRRTARARLEVPQS